MRVLLQSLERASEPSVSRARASVREREPEEKEERVQASLHPPPLARALARSSQALGDRLLLELPLEPLCPEPLGEPPAALVPALARAVAALLHALALPARTNDPLVRHGRPHDKHAVALPALVSREVVEPDAAERERERRAAGRGGAEGRAEAA